MARGRRKKQMGGRSCPPGQMMSGGKCVSTAGSGYQKGGRTRPVTRQRGGKGGGRITNRLRRQNGGGNRYVFASTGQPYNGKVIDIGGSIFTTTTGTKEHNSQKVVSLAEYNKGKGG